MRIFISLTVSRSLSLGLHFAILATITPDIALKHLSSRDAGILRLCSLDHLSARITGKSGLYGTLSRRLPGMYLTPSHLWLNISCERHHRMKPTSEMSVCSLAARILTEVTVADVNSYSKYYHRLRLNA